MDFFSNEIILFIIECRADRKSVFHEPRKLLKIPKLQRFLLFFWYFLFSCSCYFYKNLISMDMQMVNTNNFFNELVHILKIFNTLNINVYCNQHFHGSHYYENKGIK